MMTQLTTPRLWCVLPTLNEAPTLVHLVPALLAIAPDLGFFGIDDHSTDGTVAIWDTSWNPMPEGWSSPATFLVGAGIRSGHPPPGSSQGFAVNAAISITYRARVKFREKGGIGGCRFRLQPTPPVSAVQP